MSSSAGGIALAGLLLVLALVMTSNASFAKTYVRDQLGQQNITFKSVDTLTEDEARSTCLVGFAGQQLTTGKQAECYANDFIGLHVKSIPDGQTLHRLALATGMAVVIASAAYARRRAHRAPWSMPSGRVVQTSSLSARVLGESGPPILLLHGLVASGIYWGAAYDGLAEHHGLVVPDLLGFGRSPRPDSGYGPDDHAEAVLRLPREIASDAVQHTWTSYSQTLRLVILAAEASAWLDQVTCPVTLVAGDHDPSSISTTCTSWPKHMTTSRCARCRPTTTSH